MEYFAYNPGYLTCGACGFSMGPPPRITTSLFRLQVVCMNPSCANYRKIMNVGDEHKVSLVFTGVMAPEPIQIGGGNIGTAGMTTGRNVTT